MIYDDSQLLPLCNFEEFSVVKDCGLRFANYGYAFSAGLVGHYRFFLIKFPNGNHQVVSLSIYHQHDWGTYLMVAVDNRQGHALELRLDKYLSIIDKDRFRLWHNGSITVGKRGRLKNAETLEFAQNYAPFLIENGQILLGDLLSIQDLTFDKKEAKNFLYRIASYAIMREIMRKEKKPAAKKS